MFVGYSVLIIVIGLSLTEGVYQKKRPVQDDPSRPLSLDEAYLIVRNTNSSDAIILFGNKIICESCDLVRMATVIPNHNSTTILSTKYAYDLEIRSEQSNISLLCQIASYKFAEHGTYMFDVKQVTPTTTICSIKQIGNPSYYMAPAIVGIVFVVLYVILVQLWPHLYRSQYFDRLRSKSPHERLINHNPGAESIVSVKNPVNESDADILRVNASISELPLAGSTPVSNKSIFNTRGLPKRLRALDTFRGFSLMVMIFVNYGGGGYWFFDHSTWNGLTLADLVFPWFTWMMGVSIVLSQRSLRSKNVRKRSILLKICRRTIILFVLGLSEQDGIPTFTNLRILGVLQRLALCYFFTALLVLAFDKNDDERQSLIGKIYLSDDNNLRFLGKDVDQPLRTELYKTFFQFWLQWLLVLLFIVVWTLLTFLLPVPNCPTGYLGPGGKHDHGKYANCTGGAAGYIDRVVLGNSHLYNEPTCKEIYHTKLPYDPEGILGILTGILLCYLGVQAGHIFVYSTRARRICASWVFSGIICGFLGLLLSHGGHSNGWIPINKNFWSLTFVLTLSSLAFFNLTVLYLLVDVRQWFTGTPFLWLGMNSIVIYICHDRFATSFPVQFDVNNTHAEQLAVHLFGSFFWSFVAGFLYYKKIFIAI